MDNTLPSFDDFNEPTVSRGITLDYKRVFSLALRLWYLVLLSIIVALTMAFLINRYTTRIYPVTASIIIREPAENTDAGFLYNNPLVNSYRNFFNEPYIIRSYPLIQTVVEELNFQVSIQKEGNIKIVEQYTLPIDIELITKNKPGVFILELVGPDSFRCVEYGSEKNTSSKFNEVVTCSGISFRVVAVGDVSRVVGEQYKVIVQDPLAVAAVYVNKLKVSWAEQGSSVVNLDINGPIPQKEIDFLRQLIREYQEYDLEKKSQAASRSLIFIEDQLQNMGDSLRIFENALETFKRKNFITDLSLESQQLYDRFKEFNEQKTQVHFSSNYYDYLEKYLREENDFSQVILPSTIGLEDGILNTLVNQLVSLQSELILLPDSKDLENPIIVAKAKRLRSAISDSRTKIRSAISSLRNTDRIKSMGINQQIGIIEAQLKVLPVAERKLINIQRNYAFSENIYNFLQQKKAEAGISRASTTSDISVVNPPRMNGNAITPRVMQNYLLFGIFGLLFPFAAFVLVELFNVKIQSKEDIEKVTNIPFIGGIGHSSAINNLVVYEKPKSVMAESFRALRSNLNFFTEGKDKKTFLITSSLSGEGKSFTTINLATVFALAGKRTLIIGADMRKPKIFEDFGLDNQKGLSSYLAGVTSLDEIVQSTPVENLYIISGGPVPPNPSELLLTGRMNELMQELKKTYEFILIDTPPLALITDGLVLAKYADHTVFIVRQNYTPRGVLSAAHDLYSTGKIKNLSIVLNDVYKTGPGYGYGTYSYGYGYDYYYGRKEGDSSYYSEG